MGPAVSNPGEVIVNDYSEKFLDHYRRPRRVGDLETADAVAIVHDDTCGDMVRIALRTSEDRRIVAEVAIKAYGCAAAIAAASIMGELAEGRPIESIGEIDEKALDEALGGVPASRAHALAVACEAMRRAISDLNAG